jgi:SAM-dependent methyltransferase
MTDADWGAVAVTKAPGFGTATSVVELGAGDFSRSLALGERYADKRFLSTDYQFSAKADANRALVDAAPNVTVQQLDARTIDLEPESVDFIFSIALMEHIAELEQCLQAVHRALRPGGVYFYVQAPFWTCAQGHHFRHSEDRTYEFIPKYSHLTHGRGEFEELLRAGPEPPFDIGSCVQMIYDRPDLSRLGLFATRSIVESGPLYLQSWKQTPDKRYDEDAARGAFPRLRAPARFEELAVSGAEVVLTKRGQGSRHLVSRASHWARSAARRTGRSLFKRSSRT